MAEPVSRISEERLRNIEISKEYGQMVVRLLFTANAGAIVAFLALIGTLFENLTGLSVGPRLVAASVACFTLGAGTAIGLAALGYFNFGFNALRLGEQERTGMPDSQKEQALTAKVDATYRAARWVAAVSGVFFVTGVALASWAIIVTLGGSLTTPS